MFAKFISSINPDVYVSMIINTYTFYKGDLGGKTPLVDFLFKNQRKWRLKLYLEILLFARGP